MVDINVFKMVLFLFINMYFLVSEIKTNKQPIASLRGSRYHQSYKIKLV